MIGVSLPLYYSVCAYVRGYVVPAFDSESGVCGTYPLEIFDLHVHTKFVC